MDTQRINNYQPFQNSDLAEPEGLDALQQVRQQSDALLRAADDVINHVLSRDSEQFLLQARQHGGQ